MDAVIAPEGCDVVAGPGRIHHHLYERKRRGEERRGGRGEEREWQVKGAEGER